MLHGVWREWVPEPAPVSELGSVPVSELVRESGFGVGAGSRRRSGWVVSAMFRDTLRTLRRTGERKLPNAGLDTASAEDCHQDCAKKRMTE